MEDCSGDSITRIERKGGEQKVASRRSVGVRQSYRVRWSLGRGIRFFLACSATSLRAALCLQLVFAPRCVASCTSPFRRRGSSSVYTTIPPLLSEDAKLSKRKLIMRCRRVHFALVLKLPYRSGTVGSRHTLRHFSSIPLA